MNMPLVINEFDHVGQHTNSPEVHPVLVVAKGSTTPELFPVLQAQLEGRNDLVPWLGVVVDTLPYDDMITRLVQNGWPPEQVTAAIPRGSYFHLTSPFTTDFDFENPLNRAWLSTIFEPSLRRLAAKPNAPGCAGIPALGRARVEGNEQELRDFFERHLLQLTQIRPETLVLREGVQVFVVTTYRGGTGTGAATTGAAVLRTVLQHGEIHLHALMPCIYQGDPHARANAYAMLRENQWYHRFEGGVPMKGGRLLKAPFDTTTYAFASNGAVALSPLDALMQEAAILRAYLRAPTQSAINARHVDLTDVMPHDPQDMPMHVRVETATSIRTMRPGVQDYMATAWVVQEHEAMRARFESWYQNGTLSATDAMRLKEIVGQMVADLHLTREALLARLDPTPAPANVLRGYFEQANSAIASMKADAVKQSMGGLPSQIRDLFTTFERAWDERARQLAAALPDEITNVVLQKMATEPHLALAVIEHLRTHLAHLADEAEKDAKREQQKRDAASSRLGAALKAVAESTGIIWFINRDEVTRDAAHKACVVAMEASTSRAQQQRLETLIRVLAGETTILDNPGTPVVLPAITTALRDIDLKQRAAIRERQAHQQANLEARLEALGQRIEKRSQIFERALLYDHMRRAQLDAMVRELRTDFPAAPPIVKFLESSQDLPKTLAELLPLLPSYVESGQSLTQLLSNDGAQRNQVLRTLRQCRPFTPLDQTVEYQQGLRNRRDTLMILEVPGGQDGPLAALMLQQGIVANRNQIVDAGDDEIRLYVLRDGLPYAAMSPLAQYKERHDTYIATPTVITPYTVPGAHQLPGMEPARTNLLTHVEGLLYVLKAVLPHRLAPKPPAGFTLRYEAETGSSFATTREEAFQDFGAMVGWLAQRVRVRKALEGELAQRFEDNPETYKAALVTAWRQATESERDHLQEALFHLRVDPYRWLQTPAGSVPREAVTTNSAVH